MEDITFEHGNFFYRMDLHGPEEFSNPVPTLPPGVALCEGIPRAKWVTKNVTITDEMGMDVAKGVCQNVDPELVIDLDGKPLGDDRVAIQIAESLCEEIILSSRSSQSLFSFRAFNRYVSSSNAS